MAGATCYYPNGEPAVGGDIPCGSGPGVACCPLNWECRSNGLCYLGAQNYLGRYSCTDQSWQSSDCPQICTYGRNLITIDPSIDVAYQTKPDGTAYGAEAVLECSSGNFCCDANRPSISCCTNNTQLFTLDNRKRALNLSSTPSVPSSSSFSSTEPASSASSPHTTEFLSTSRVAGGTSVVVLTSVMTQSASSLPTSNSPPSRAPSSTIIAAVVVPIAVILLAALLFILFRRRQRKPSVRSLEPWNIDTLQDPHKLRDPAELSSSDEKAELPGSVRGRHVDGSAELAARWHEGIPELEAPPKTTAS